MNFTTAMGFVAGILQFVVAGYALRLNRLFGVKRVGWSLFCAFLLLAVLHLMQTVMHGGFGEEIGIKIDVMNALISLLLLIGMVHLEAMLKERRRVETEEQRMRAELESEVKKKTAYLTRALEELQAEIDKSKCMEVQARSARWELNTVSRWTEMAQIASNAMKSVGDTLKSVNISANLVASQMKPSKIATTLLAELESVKANLQKLAVMQQDYAKLAAEPDQATATSNQPLPQHKETVAAE